MRIVIARYRQPSGLAIELERYDRDGRPWGCARVRVSHGQRYESECGSGMSADSIERTIAQWHAFEQGIGSERLDNEVFGGEW